MVVLHSIKIYLETNGRMQSTRMATPSNMRRIATEFTGCAYARSRKGLQQAHDDLVKLSEGKTLDQIGEVAEVNALVGGVAADLAEDGQ